MDVVILEHNLMTGHSIVENRVTAQNTTPTLQGSATSLPQSRRKRRHRRLEWLVCLWVARNTEELERIKKGNYSESTDPPYVAARVAIGCFLMFIIHTTVLIWAGVVWNIAQHKSWSQRNGGEVMLVALIWSLYRCVQTVKQFLNQMYFILEEVQERKEELAAITVSAKGARGNETVVASKGSSQRSTLSEPGTYSGAGREGEEDEFIMPPVRHSMEIDLGSMPFVTRQTYSRFC
jgi:hypothetical protein